MTPAPHENLRVYRRALDAVAVLETVALQIPDLRRDLADQLRRASASIPLNIAEGAAEFSAAEKARFYRMARRSAAECIAILDVLERVLPAHIQAAATPAARSELDAIMALTTRLVQSADARRR